jgi:hypothetical protein
MLERKRQTDQCLDVARVASERGKEPFLSETNAVFRALRYSAEEIARAEATARD